MAVLICWLGLLLGGSAQTAPALMAESDLPPAPQHGIHDPGGFFDRHPEVRKRIDNRIRTLNLKHNYRILLMVEPVLISSNAPTLAAQLQQFWLPDGNGLVIVFESDTRKVGFGFKVGEDPTRPKPPGSVPNHETSAILRHATESNDPEIAPELYIEGLTTRIADGVGHHFTQRAEPPPTGRSMRLMLLTIGGLSLVSLGAIAVILLSRLPSMAPRQCYRFPEISRPERLGAPCGGGNVTVRSFRTDPGSHEP